MGKVSSPLSLFHLSFDADKGLNILNLIMLYIVDIMHCEFRYSNMQPWDNANFICNIYYMTCIDIINSLDSSKNELSLRLYISMWGNTKRKKITEILGDIVRMWITNIKKCLSLVPTNIFQLKIVKQNRNQKSNRTKTSLNCRMEMVSQPISCYKKVT